MFRLCFLHAFKMTRIPGLQSRAWPTNKVHRSLRHSSTFPTCFEFLYRYSTRHGLSELKVTTKFGHSVNFIQTRLKSGGKNDSGYLSSLIQPLPVKPSREHDGISVGEELTRTLNKEDLLRLLNTFCRRPEVIKLASENGLDGNLFHQAYLDFRRYCIESAHLPVDLHIIFSDILQEAGHIDDIFPYFIRHAKAIFPHLDCIDDLKKISDLRRPANWYPEARALERKIIFHAGPTNSGKTYHALERFYAAKSGVYCGPLRLLATEVFNKSNKMGTKCDLITGEEQQLADSDGEPSSHLSCTVEMTSVSVPYEVAVIDEIQMIRDIQRGWAWTRAFLGVCAQEVHVCGESSAIGIIKELALTTGDQVEVRTYRRLTNLRVLTEAVESFDHVKPGDCFVCFRKNDIYTVSRQLEKRCIEVAVIYGTLPPGTKLAQAEKFNSPESSCKVLVATDAIGMGLNLNIKRVIFYSLMKPHINEKGEKEMHLVTPSAALQIAGRAGRYASEFVEGEVTCFKSNDLQILRKLLNTDVESVQQAGLHPTAEQIELFAYHLPKATLSNLIDIFITLCQLDNDKYFMCHVEDFKFLADMIEHIPLQLRVRYVFCCAPIPKKQAFVCAMFLKFARQFSRGQPLTLEWMCSQLGWPLRIPVTLTELVHLESVFDVLDLYLWLSYRFVDMFPNADHIRDMQKELDRIIHIGILNITRLLQNTETKISSGISDNEDDFEIQNRTNQARHLKMYDATSSPADEDNALAGKSLISHNWTHQKHIDNQKGFESFTEIAVEDNDRSSDSLNFGSVRLQPGERLADQLLKRGLLTKDMLKKLQQELKEQTVETVDNKGKYKDND